VYCNHGLMHAIVGGTCIDKLNGFSCNCSIGFVGAYCQTNVNECLSSPCQNCMWSQASAGTERDLTSRMRINESMYVLDRRNMCGRNCVVHMSVSVAVPVRVRIACPKTPNICELFLSA
jgi:hypothetical protein